MRIWIRCSFYRQRPPRIAPVPRASRLALPKPRGVSINHFNVQMGLYLRAASLAAG